MDSNHDKVIQSHLGLRRFRHRRAPLKIVRDFGYNRVVSDEDTGARTRPETKGDEPPKVLISYSHDSAEHKERVLGFAQ
jgi:hypothetical protein